MADMFHLQLEELCFLPLLHWTMWLTQSIYPFTAKRGLGQNGGLQLDLTPKAISSSELCCTQLKEVQVVCHMLAWMPIPHATFVGFPTSPHATQEMPTPSSSPLTIVIFLLTITLLTHRTSTIQYKELKTKCQ